LSTPQTRPQARAGGFVSCDWTSDPQEIAEVRRLTPIDAFTTRENRTIYRAMGRLLDRGELVEVGLLSMELEEEGELEAVGGRPYLATLEASNELEQPVAVARQLHRDVTRRRLIQAVEGGRTTEEMIEAVSGVVKATAEARQEAAQVVTLSDLLDDPAILEPPPELVFPLAWKDRSTLLSAREKTGKSTLVRGAIAAKTRGRPFLGRTPEPGDALLFALEEHTGDVARSLHEFDAYGPAAHIVRQLGSDRYATVENAIRQTGAEFVVIDTLAAFTKGLELKSGDSSGWTDVVQSLPNLARDLHVGLVLVHHGQKEDGCYRDSTAIGGGVDMLLALSAGDVQGVRKLTPVGRWELEPMSYRIKDATDEWPATFQLTSGDLSIDTMVLMYIEANPGCTTNDVKGRIKARAVEVGSALHRLAGKAIENRGSERRSSWYVKEGRS